jgi:S-methylmethionine-dependent homocysteine/selenocysteine methylase
MVNCVYPTFICAERQPAALFERLIGIQANSSSLDHTELDGASVLHQDDLQHWGENMLRLNSEFGVKILGGCCGTDNTYLQYLADHRTV